MKVDLKTDIAGIKLKNPVICASGTFGYGNEVDDLIDLSKIGAIITKTITLKPREGNPPPRLVETASGILNSIGLQNVGAERFLTEKSGIYKKFPVPVIVSVAGSSRDEYIEVVRRLNKEKWVSGIELNLSCPNLQKKIISQDASCTRDIVSSVKKVSRVPVIAKLTPQVSDISVIAQTAESAGADAVSVVNTFPGMAINVKTFKPKLANIAGGLSGPAIKPLALKCVWDVCKKVRIPVIGCGGIMTGEDAVEFFLAGAKAVCIGTANLVDAESSVKIVDGINKYLVKMKIKSLKNIIGKIKN